MMPAGVLDHIDANFQSSLDDLFEFLRLPDVSPDDSHKADMRTAAAWLLGYIRRLGLRAELFETPGNPIVFAGVQQEKNAPTLLIYAHYDVAPPGHEEDWKTPPFAPAVRDGSIYARGAVDDKGQLFAVLQAIAAVIAAEGRLPLNVKLLLDGEEEMGSPSLGAFVREHAELLQADAAVVVDILKYRADLPAIYYGAKGLLSVNIAASGPARDLHSGIYGGGVASPADALVRLLAGLKNGDGKILLPGFYDQVRGIGPGERAELAALPFDEPALERLIGVRPVAQERGYTPLECAMARPTLSVNGLWGGALPGAPLMVIPARAGALVSFRLVPDQQPAAVFRQLKTYVDKMKPPGIGITMKVHVCEEPFVTARDSCAVRAARRALAAAFGGRPVLLRSGGTSGVVPLLMKATGIRNVVITGWGDPGAGEHSANEHLSLENYRRGIIATAALMYELALDTKATNSIGH